MMGAKIALCADCEAEFADLEGENHLLEEESIHASNHGLAHRWHDRDDRGAYADFFPARFGALLHREGHWNLGRILGNDCARLCYGRVEWLGKSGHRRTTLGGKIVEPTQSVYAGNMSQEMLDDNLKLTSFDCEKMPQLEIALVEVHAVIMQWLHLLIGQPLVFEFGWIS